MTGYFRRRRRRRAVASYKTGTT